MAIIVKVFEDGEEVHSQELPDNEYVVLCGKNRELSTIEHQDEGVVVLTVTPKEGAPLASHADVDEGDSEDDEE
jgi:hypothetical protein